MAPTRRRRAAMTLAAIVAISGAGCTTGQRTAPPSYDGPPASARTSPTPVAPSAPPAPPVPPGPVTIALAGDVHFEGVLKGRLADPATALAPVTSALAAADLAMVNLETSVGVGGQPEPGKRYPFQAPPSAVRALAEAGIDVATMANNHALDFGRQPLPDLFSIIDRSSSPDPSRDPLEVVGIGRDAAAAFAPALVDVDGAVVATIGTTVADQDPTADPTGQWAATTDSPGTADALAAPERLLQSVRAADRAADVVVVYVHWGIQGERCPSEDQRSLARRLMTAGADVVAGSHTHGLQGDGPLDGPWGRGYVAYGLGNYAWYTPTALTGVLTLTVQPAAERAGRARVTDAAWEPATIGSDGLPAPLRGAAARDAHAEIASLRGCAGLGR